MPFCVYVTSCCCFVLSRLWHLTKRSTKTQNDTNWPIECWKKANDECLFTRITPELSCMDFIPLGCLRWELSSLKLCVDALFLKQWLNQTNRRGKEATILVPLRTRMWVCVSVCVSFLGLFCLYLCDYPIYNGVRVTVEKYKSIFHSVCGSSFVLTMLWRHC